MEATKVSEEFFEKTGRKTYITSASYLELIKSFSLLTNRKQNELTTAKNRYLGGLEKLYHASISISEMQHSLAELQPQLKEMSEKATEMLKQIEKETATVEKISAVVQQDEKVTKGYGHGMVGTCNLLDSQQASCSCPGFKAGMRS